MLNGLLSFENFSVVFVPFIIIKTSVLPVPILHGRELLKEIY